MTEAEWFSAERSGPLLHFIEPRTSDRKPHYFDIACARRIAPLLPIPASLHGVDVLERFVEGQCGGEDLRQLRWDVEGAAFCADYGGDIPWLEAIEQLPTSLLTELVADPTYTIRDVRDLLTSAAYFVDALFSPVPAERHAPVRADLCRWSVPSRCAGA